MLPGKLDILVAGQIESLKVVVLLEYFLDSFTRGTLIRMIHFNGEAAQQDRLAHHVADIEIERNVRKSSKGQTSDKYCFNPFGVLLELLLPGN